MARGIEAAAAVTGHGGPPPASQPAAGLRLNTACMRSDAGSHLHLLLEHLLGLLELLEPLGHLLERIGGRFNIGLAQPSVTTTSAKYTWLLVTELQE
eukprot:3265075-Rhodomonas_salina.1